MLTGSVVIGDGATAFKTNEFVIQAGGVCGRTIMTDAESALLRLMIKRMRCTKITADFNGVHKHE